MVIAEPKPKPPLCDDCRNPVATWIQWFKEDCPEGGGHTLDSEIRDTLPKE